MPASGIDVKKSAVSRLDECGIKRGRGRPAATATPAAPDADLLALAFQTFADLGYDGASTRDLTRRLGVSHNLIHSRFGSKDNLWRSAVDYCLGETTRIYEEIYAAGYADEAERLRALVMNFTSWMAEKPHFVRIVITEGSRESWRLDYLHDNYIMPYHHKLDGLLKRIARQHKTRAIDSVAFHILLVHGIGGFYALNPLTQRLARATKSKNASGEAELFANLLLSSVFAQKK